MATKDPLIGRPVRINADATTLKGKPHPNAGMEGTVAGKTPGGRQYQVKVGEELINLPMADFTVVNAIVDLPAEHDAAVHELVPSRTNRAVREDEDLLAMAATMKTVGVLEPILVRRLPAERLQDTFENADTRKAVYEIIAGERRWVAAKIAGLKRVPILVKAADDSIALIMQLIENLHRRDLNPLDEARGIQRLVQDHNYTREDAAEALHKSRTHVFESLRLLNLCPEALAAIDAGTLKRSVALLVAQRPTMAMQAEFTKRVLTEGPDKGPLSYRSALDLAKRNYMTDLAQAPFALDDAQLRPTAGACASCPKRTGANPELWDKSGADVCTDTSCFADKKEAHYERMRRHAAERGQKVITGREAREIMPTDNASPAGYLLLDKPSQGSSAPLRQVLGQDVPAAKVVLIETPAGTLVEAVPTRAAGAALEARGKAQAEKAKAKQPEAPEPTREELQAEYQRRWRGEAVRAVIDGLRNKADPDELDDLPSVVAFRVILCIARETDDELLHVIFPELRPDFSEADLAEMVRNITKTDNHLLRHMLMMMLAACVDTEPLFDRPADEALHLAAVAPAAHVDLKAIQQQIQGAMKAEAADRAQAKQPQQTDKAKPALKGAAKPKTSKADAQAAIAEAMRNASTDPQFTEGQSVRLKVDVKNSKGDLVRCTGALATIVRPEGDRHWIVSLPEVWPFPGTKPKSQELTVDYTELETADE